MGTLLPTAGKAVFNRISPKAKPPNKKMACSYIALYDLLRSKAEYEKDYFDNSLFFKPVADKFLRPGAYRDDLFAAILHRAIDQDIWKTWRDWDDGYLWLARIYSDPNGLLYNPAIAEHLFRRLLIEKHMTNPWIKTEQCTERARQERTAPGYTNIRFKALKWFESLCAMSDDNLFQEAAYYENGQNGYPRDPYMAIQLYYRSNHPDSIKATQRLREERTKNKRK